MLWFFHRSGCDRQNCTFRRVNPAPVFRQARLNFPGGPQDGVSLYCRLPPGCALSPGTGGAAGRGVSGLPSGNRGTGCSIRRLVPRFLPPYRIFSVCFCQYQHWRKQTWFYFRVSAHCYIEGFVWGMHCASGLFSRPPAESLRNHSSTAGYEISLVNHVHLYLQKAAALCQGNPPNEVRGPPEAKTARAADGPDDGNESSLPSKRKRNFAGRKFYPKL